MQASEWDVVVVGAGNAALAAAASARESGAERVVVLEKAVRQERGGNTRFSGGLLRFAYDRVEQVLEVAPEAAHLEGLIDGIEPYPEPAFWEDLLRVTDGRADPELGRMLVAR